jgi:hypothetical protein
MPAQPPLSEPAMVNAAGYRFVLFIYIFLPAIKKREFNIIPAAALPASGYQGLIFAFDGAS